MIMARRNRNRNPTANLYSAAEPQPKTNTKATTEDTKGTRRKAKSKLLSQSYLKSSQHEKNLMDSSTARRRRNLRNPTCTAETRRTAKSEPTPQPQRTRSNTEKSTKILCGWRTFQPIVAQMPLRQHRGAQLPLGLPGREWTWSFWAKPFEAL